MTTCQKCGHTRTLNDDPAVPVYQCPACGVVYAKAAGDPGRRSPPKAKPAPTPNSRASLGSSPTQAPPPGPTDSDWMRDNLECQRWQTANVVHCLLTLVTAGVWLFVWFFVIASNTRERNKIHRRYGVPTESNLLMVVFVVFIGIWLYGAVSIWLS